MADTYHIIDGQVVPFNGGRKCNNTDAWRDATPLELQLQEQLAESKHVIVVQAAEIEALREEVEQLAASEKTCRRIANEKTLEAMALREALAALKAENERLREALKDADNELDWLDEDMDTCDHSVGVCTCDYWNMRRKMKAALAKGNSND